MVGNYVADRQQSMLRFDAMMKAGLREAGYPARIIRPEMRLGGFGKARRGLSKWLGYVDKFVLFPARLRAASASVDVVHICDHGYSLYAKHLDAVPCVVTCHDLISVRCARGEIPGQQTRWSGRKYQQMIVNGLERARSVACDSEATRSDFLRLCRLAASKVPIIHVALNPVYRPAAEAERAARLARLGMDLKGRFVLHVGASWYKNRSGVIKIFQHLVQNIRAQDLGLVMVGGNWTADLNSLVQKLGLAHRIRLFSDLDNEDLRALYSTAIALLFPSLYEGFGWPIIEAQACGCPVFTSNRPPMTEVGGDGAVYIDPEQPKQAAATILENLPHAQRMLEAGFVNVVRFSVDRMIAGYLKLYADALRPPSTGASQDVAHSIEVAEVSTASGKRYPLSQRS